MLKTEFNLKPLFQMAFYKIKPDIPIITELLNSASKTPLCFWRGPGRLSLCVKHYISTHDQTAFLKVRSCDSLQINDKSRLFMLF
jgi:hypothetical protein